MSRAADAVATEALQVRFATGLADLEALEAEWRALEEAAGDGAVFFQTFDWNLQVARIRLERSAAAFRPCVASVHDGDRLIGIWPLAVHREGICWILRSLDHPFGQFAGVLFRDDTLITPGMRAVIEALKAGRRADGILLDKVVEPSSLGRSLTQLGARSQLSDQAVFLDLRPFGSFEAYHKTVNVKTRKNLRNARNRLGKSHTFSHEVITEPGRLATLIRESFAGRLVWMNTHGKTSPAFRDGDFLSVLSSLSTAGIDLLGFELRTPSAVIAVQWGIVHRQRYYAYLSARNPAFDPFSPGRVHLGMVIEECARRGYQVIELMSPPSDYKLNWTKSLTRLDEVRLALTPKGQIYLELWRAGLREVVKSAFHRLPAGMRRQVTWVDDTALAPPTR